MTSFRDLGLRAEFVDALAAQGIDDPFAIQEATIADALAGRDVCGKARTGSGKTLAFGLPMLQTVAAAKPGHPTALVLVPTRELAKQVVDVLSPLGKAIGMRVAAFYGGTSLDKQVRNLTQAHRDRGRDTRPHDRPARARRARPRPGRDPRDRRSRPHGRHGLPAAGRVDHAQGSQGPPPDAPVLRDARPRGRRARAPLHARSRAATRWRPTPRASTT